MQINMAETATTHELSDRYKRRLQQQKEQQLNSLEKNPCYNESKLSMECMSTHENCEVYFDNYRRCKKFWGRVMADRQKKGIVPLLPPVAERPKVMEEYRRFMAT